MTVTIISVLVALGIGTAELLSVLASELKLTGPLWSVIGNLDFEAIGFGIVGIFVVSWLASLAYWRYRRFDELYVPAPTPELRAG